MDTTADTPPVSSRTKLVARYAVTLFLLTVLAGVLVGVARRLLPQVVPVHAVGALDAGAILNLVGTALVALLVYRHLAVRRPQLYWKTAIPIAVLTAVGSLLCFALLSPEAAGQYFVRLLLLAAAFQLAMTFLASFFRPKATIDSESPNISLERTREG